MSATNTVPTLYWNQFSICSLMANYTLTVQNKLATSEEKIKYKTKHIDIYTNEQLTEDYLANVNPKGQVPALLNIKPHDLTDSKDITLWVGQQYPPMLPSQHKQEITKLLDELHQIPFPLLTFHKYGQRLDMITDFVNEKLESDSISETYRKALIFKMNYMKDYSEPFDGMSDAALGKAERLCQTYLAKIVDIIKREKSQDQPYIYGTHATILDTSLIAFVARCDDMRREYLVPEEIEKMFRPLINGKEWQSVTDGKPTWFYRYSKVASDEVSLRTV